MECLRCKGKMESGFVGDAGHYNSVQRPVWYSGRYEWSFWGGLKLGGRKRFPIQTLRCKDCGYLESYASELRVGG